MLGGIIASALGGAGGAVAEMAGDQIKQDQRVALMREQEEMERRRAEYADQLARSRAEWEVDPGGLGGKKIAHEVKRISEVGPAETAQQVARTEALIPAEVKREQTLAPVKLTNAVSQAKAVKTAELDVERADTLVKGTDKNYLKAVAALSDAKESSATRAAAAKTVYEMNRQKYVDNLRDVASGLMAAGDKAGAEEQLRVADMASGKAQAKNFTDVAAFAKVLESQAAALVDPAKGGDPTNPENVAQATAIRQRIQEMAADVSSKRGVAGGGGGPAAPAAPSIPAPKTKEEFDKLPKGTRYTAPDGSVRIKQ